MLGWKDWREKETSFLRLKDSGISTHAGLDNHMIDIVILVGAAFLVP